MLESPMTSEKTPRRKLKLPPGMPQIAALLLVLLIDSLVANNFFAVHLQDGASVRQSDRYS
ncbi:Uncharacterised protein [Pantoea agglomerans]|uniref:Uncharacterized protein n=1 Tax=Enterobacter agglomerans TaxID=549 RepID=A0A379AGB2_ENTAG|nr:Uncharacterised protein [Pantoea agglomerans]